MNLYIYKGVGNNEDKGKELINIALKNYTGDNNVRLSIKRTESGKPYFSNLNINFSVSHSNDVWACLMADFNVGLDIQEERTVAYEKISKRFFVKDEYEYIREKGKEAFFDIWTGKEAFVKYTGNGFAKEGFDTFKVICNGEIAKEIIWNDEQVQLYKLNMNIKMREALEFRNFYGAVCSAKEEKIYYKYIALSGEVLDYD